MYRFFFSPFLFLQRQNPWDKITHTHTLTRYVINLMATGRGDGTNETRRRSKIIYTAIADLPIIVVDEKPNGKLV